MPSTALQCWQTSSTHKLDEFENAHRAVTGGRTGRGRRYLTEQLNHAYLVALAAQFQKLCRDLHSEATNHLLQPIDNQDVRQACLSVMTQGRKLDSGNANSANITNDFKRLGIMNVFDDLVSLDSRNGARKKQLDHLIDWRNAISHQNFTRLKAGSVNFGQVRRWRRTLDDLSSALDQVVAAHLGRVVGTRPWR